MPKPTGPTIKSVIAQVAAQLTEPITFDQFAQRVLAIKPSTAKDPKSSVRSNLTFDLLEHGLLYLDDRKQVIAPINPLIPGVRFRHVVSEREADHGLIVLDANICAFLPGPAYVMPQTLLSGSLLDDAGNSTPIQLGSVSEEVTSFFDKKIHTLQRPGIQLTDWFLQHEVKAGDSILITIETWNPPCWRLFYEPAAQRLENATRIAERNQALVEILFDRLEASTEESIYVREALLAAHLRMDGPTGYPGDPWLDALAQDGRMRAGDTSIAYANGRKSFFDSFMDDASQEEEEEESKVLSQAEAQQVYRFKAEFTYRKSIWRKIEILGEQTLADLNFCLVDAFQHDNDHMGGFWRRIRRGASTRYREVALGTVAPWGGGGENEDLQIAAIGLRPGDEIKYVYDFGDSHQHLLTLEEILPNPPAEEGVSTGKKRKKKSESLYPRIIEQNQPKYKQCEECKKKGKETVATWACVDCSNKEQREMAYCEKCADKFHEDHYTVGSVY